MTTGAPKLWIYDDTVLAYGPVNPGPAVLVGPCIGNESQHLITLARHIHGSNSPFINAVTCIGLRHVLLQACVRYLEAPRYRTRPIGDAFVATRVMDA